MSPSQAMPTRSSNRKWIIVLPFLIVSCTLTGYSIWRFKENEWPSKEGGDYTKIRQTMDSAGKQIVELGGTCKVLPSKGDTTACMIDLTHWCGTDQDFGILRSFLYLRRGIDVVSLKMPPSTTDSALAYMKELDNINVLDLSGTQITDKGMTHLKNLTCLWEIDLSNTAISAAGIATLFQRKPEVSVTISGGRVSRGTVRLEGPRINDATLREFVDARHFPAIFLEKTNVTDAGLDVLRGYADLEYLAVNGPSITDIGLRCIKGHERLIYLSLAGTLISDTGLRELKELRNLSSLNLEGTPITDAGLAHLAGLTRIENLYLTHTDIRDAGLAHLAGLTRIRVLYLAYTNIGDAGLKHLAALTTMERLILQGTRITDEGLTQLKGMRHLKELDLRETKVTRDAAKSFQKGMPNPLGLL